MPVKMYDPGGVCVSETVLDRLAYIFVLLLLSLKLTASQESQIHRLAALVSGIPLMPRPREGLV